jgi:hypothetical protein
MARGRTISIYLPDSNPRGIKLCHIDDSIVKSFLIPRKLLKDASTRNELKDPGVYFLFGDNDQTGKPSVYIGEAEEIFKRLKQHNLNKDFWNFAICFISEKQNLNKGHIKFMENHAFNLAKKINKCKLENFVNPTKSSLTEQEVDFVLNFFDDLKIIISSLGYPIFDELKKDKSNMYHCKGKDASAIAEYTEDGLVVYEGSKANLVEAPSSGKWVINMRQNLIDSEILRKKDDTLIFTQNYTFKSPSAAAAVILARRANGWKEWKDAAGKTMDEKIRQN